MTYFEMTEDRALTILGETDPLTATEAVYWSFIHDGMENAVEIEEKVIRILSPISYKLRKSTDIRGLIPTAKERLDKYYSMANTGQEVVSRQVTSRCDSVFANQPHFGARTLDEFFLAIDVAKKASSSDIYY